MNWLTNWIMRHNDITLTPKQRSTHTYVIGQPGTGKSRALESWIMQDISSGHGVSVIDPHGELYDHLLARIAQKPKIWEKVILFDPLDPNWAVGFNPLESIDHISSERLALYMTDICIKIRNLDPTKAPRMVWLLTNTFLALAKLNLTILDLPKFLIDRNYREELLNRIPNSEIKQYFQDEFPKTESNAYQWITPVLNKIGGLIFDPDTRMMFAEKSKINFRKIMDDQMILLINLPKGVLGEGTSALLAAFIVAHIQKTALSRISSNHLPPFYFYLDEFQNYTTDNISDILSESRKYALSLILAHQFLDQLPKTMRSAVLNTSGTIACFRVGYQDAHTIAKEIFPSPDFLELTYPQMRTRSNPMFRVPKLIQPGWEGLALELSNLQPRQFWYRRRGSNNPIKEHTFTMPDPIYTPALKSQIQALRDFSGKRYAHNKQAYKSTSSQKTYKETGLPLWTD